ncbi:GNAT family N-acetyltransferase [Algibacter miyuki]|uniref:GNAT family N-acetyltransferase n=1 Tax=Algibacter miyuki TaxID=1306933 RepID=A0ABV5GVH8_9FLAO|nr:GNAT family N-acetyltransferase [Algibacter miyuki]MDN3664950.1 GNAT family N-acetyltransferase [Algibacter miyuki]
MIHYKIYYSFKDLPEGWDPLVKHDVFLQLAYLQALEIAAPNNLELFYIGVFKKDILVGVAVTQRVQLYLKDMFRKTDISCLKSYLRDLISKILKGNILVIGNLTQTGQHGLYFKRKDISQEAFFKITQTALYEIKSIIKAKQNKTIRMFVLKDYFENDSIHKEKESLDAAKLHQVVVQPNMIFSVKRNWVTIEDYTAALQKKYRDRYKRARKKLNGIKAVELSIDDVKNNSQTLHQLYLNVSNNAKFNTFILPENHFYSLKFQLKENFRIFGYYLEDKLVGFYTLIRNNKSLETYFLGYDSEHQYKNQLYLNMLYDMLKFGIENQFKTIVYARTAMEIKSSVGAEAKPMLVYLKHTNVLMNAALKQIFKLMDPTQDWEPRHPFKAE